MQHAQAGPGTKQRVNTGAVTVTVIVIVIINLPPSPSPPPSHVTEGLRGDSSNETKRCSEQVKNDNMTTAPMASYSNFASGRDQMQTSSKTFASQLLHVSHCIRGHEGNKIFDTTS